MKHTISADDREFLAKFETQQIEPAQFNHPQHIRLAYICLVLYGPQAAFPRFRALLQAFLQHNGVDPAKYHATLTQAWLLAVFHFMEISDAQPGAADFIRANPVLLDSKIMLTHYSKEVLGGEDARREFAEPDLQPIPRHD